MNLEMLNSSLKIIIELSVIWEMKEVHTCPSTFEIWIGILYNYMDFLCWARYNYVCIYSLRLLLVYPFLWGTFAEILIWTLISLIFDKQKLQKVDIWIIHIETNPTRSHMTIFFLKYKLQKIVKVMYVNSVKSKKE